MKRWKRLLALAMSGVLLFSLAACGNKGGEGGVEYGRYVEHDITPAGLQNAPAAFYSDDKGTYDMIVLDYGDESNNYAYTIYRYRSTDRGDSWTEIDMSWTEQYLNLYDYESESNGTLTELATWDWVILNDGGVISYLDTYNYDEGERESIDFIRVDLDGNIEPIEFEGVDLGGSDYTYLSNIVGFENNKLYIEYRIVYFDANGDWTSDETVQGLYDGKTGQKLAQVELTEGGIAAYGRNLMLYESYEGGYTVVDMQTGLARQDISLPDYEALRAEGFYPYSSNTALDSEGNMVTSNQDYVQRYYADERESETVMKALNYSFGSPLKNYYWMMYDAEDELLMCLNDANGDFTLVRYEWDKDAVASTGDSIKVFSLYDNQTVRLALSQFKQDHPEVDVEYEYALERYYYMEDESEIMTVEDALRNLNNALLTGTGPDVLILDEMPLQSYMDKGVLEDISGAVQGTDIYTQLLTPYSDGGKVYAVPMRFAVPLVFGEAEDVKNYTGLEALTQAIVDGPDMPEYEEIDWENTTPEQEMAIYREREGALPWESRPTMATGSFDEIVALFFELSGPAIYNEKVGIDRDNLATYLDCVKQVALKYGVLDYSLDNGYEIDNYAVRMGGTVQSHSNSSFYSFVQQQSRTGYIQLVDYYPLQSVGYSEYSLSSPRYFYSEETGETEYEVEYYPMDIGVQTASGLASNVYTPQVIAGVCSTSKNKEVAAQFITSMLGMGVQGYDMNDGLPVTREGNQKMYDKAMERDAHMVENDIYPMELDFDSLFANLDTPYHADSYLLEIVFEHALSYTMGDISLEQAVDNIVGETDMYFAERQ